MSSGRDDLERPRLIAVVSPGCPDCRATMPAVSSALEDHGGVVLEVVDASTDPDRVRALRVFGTPTLIGVRGGREIVRTVGRRSEREVVELVDALVAGDLRRQAPPAADVALRVGAGLALALAGLVSGPAWLLVGLGSAVTGYGVAGMRRRFAARS